MPSEEAAARSAMDKIRQELQEVAVTPQVSISFQIPQPVLDKAILETVRSELRNSPIIRDFLAAKLKEYVAELAPEAENLQAMKEEVREHLSRYPSLGSDIRLQEKVALAIFNHITK